MLKPKKSIETMDAYVVPMYGESWDIKIDSNENNYGPSPEVIGSLKNCDYKNISFYPFYGEISQKIADYQDADINNIKVTNGADEALQAVMQTYLEPEDALLTLDVSFDMPVIYAQIQGGKVIKVPYKEKWVFPVSDFIKELNTNPKIKAVYIASPNNPTGSVIEEKDIVQILQNSGGRAVIIDETYAGYAGISYKKYVKEYDNVFIVRSFSKDFALAGMRLGYIISNEDNIKILKKVISPFSVNAYAMAAGIAALCDIEYLERIKAEILASKEELKNFFISLGAAVYNSHANFLLVDFEQKAEFIYNKLKNAGIAVKLFKKGSLLENHLRVTIPAKAGVKKIKEVLKLKPALVFDMDGVLVDAGNSYIAAIQKTYEFYAGEKISHKLIQDTRSGGGLNNDWDLTKYLLDKAGIVVDYEELVKTFQNLYWNNGRGLINNETPLFKRELFEELAKDYNLCVYTGRLKNEAMFAIEKFNMSDLFYPVITWGDIPEDKSKPDPYGLNLIKDITIASEYYYFGDTPDDITAAKSAGYIAVGVLPPLDKSENLCSIMKTRGADAVINSINDINMISAENFIQNTGKEVQKDEKVL